MGAKLTAEFVGTFLLVFTVGCNVLSGNAVWGGISIACVLMVAIYALGSISGANFNPAVSLALALTESAGGRGIDWKTAGTYIGVQIAAGITASLSYSLLFWDTFNLAPASGFSFWQAGICEVLYTFMLCFVVLNVAVSKDNSPNQFYGFAIGSVITAGAYGAGAVSGGCFNPAVAIGIDAASAGLGFGWCIFWTVCEFVGAAMAVGAFMAVRPGDFGKEKGMAAELISEFLGTFILVLTVGLNVLGKSHAGAYSIAASLMAMIYALGNVSGAHFNPAVTIAILASGRCPDFGPAKAGAFIASQVVGAGVAAVTYCAVHKGESFPLGPGAGFGYAAVGVAEAVFTFVLCYVVLCVAVSSTTNAPIMFGLAIGACVTAGGNAIGAISGGSLNPAVSFGIVLANLSDGGSVVPFLAYSAFELVGAVAAAGVFKVTHAVDEVGLKDVESKA
mmetsp:Transcript_77952/g.252870  ORF Transcript_77952/g.252870 Transcript_77952/m.252870 type:complete len:448 (+) Transcript_77952:112-1455(+)